MLLNRVVCLVGHKGCPVTPLPPPPSYVEGIIFSQVSVHKAVGVRVPFMTCRGPSTLAQWGTLGSLVNGWRLTGDDDMMSSTEGKEATRGRSCEFLQSFLHGLSGQSILKLWRKVCLHIRPLFNCGRERELVGVSERTEGLAPSLYYSWRPNEFKDRLFSIRSQRRALWFLWLEYSMVWNSYMKHLALTRLEKKYTGSTILVLKNTWLPNNTSEYLIISYLLSSTSLFIALKHKMLFNTYPKRRLI